MKHRKKKLATAAAIVAVVGLVGGGTFATWTADASLENNTVQAGYLQLDLQTTAGGTVTPFNVGPVAPGMPTHEQKWFVANNSSTPDIGATLHMQLENLSAPAFEDQALANQTMVRIHTQEPQPDGSCGGGQWGSHGFKSVADWINDGDFQIGPSSFLVLGDGDGMCVRMRLEFPTDGTMNNDSQNGEISFDTAFELRQDI